MEVQSTYSVGPRAVTLENLKHERMNEKLSYFGCQAGDIHFRLHMRWLSFHSRYSFQRSTPYGHSSHKGRLGKMTGCDFKEMSVPVAHWEAN